jgi:hypothetical protein
VGQRLKERTEAAVVGAPTEKRFGVKRGIGSRMGGMEARIEEAVKKS